MNLSRPGRLCRVFAIGLLSLIAAAAADTATTVILVRHAERAGGMDPDVGISDAGQCRAKTLAAMLADAGVRAIYTSEVKRTQQTAEPIATKLAIRPGIVPAKDVDGLVSKLRASPGT